LRQPDEITSHITYMQERYVQTKIAKRMR